MRGEDLDGIERSINIKAAFHLSDNCESACESFNSKITRCTREFHYLHFNYLPIPAPLLLSHAFAVIPKPNMLWERTMTTTICNNHVNIY